MEEPTERSTGPIIAGVVGLVALALTIVGALVLVDHINVPGTNHASAPQQQPAPAPSPAPAATPDNTNPAPSPAEKKN
jgi:hypothetical protein